MSLVKLQLAVRNTLRTQLPILDAALFPAAGINNVVDLQAGGQPPPAAGQLYLAVHGTDWTSGPAEMQQGTEEHFGVAVTITRKTSAAPTDRQTETFYVNASIGLDHIARLVNQVVMQGNYVILNAANAAIIGTDKFQEPLRWAGTDAEPTERGDTWFWATEKKATQLATGWSLQTRFSGAVRIQELSVMT